MVIRELVREIGSELEDNARFEAELIVMRAAGLTRTELVTQSRREVSGAEYENALGMTARRKAGEPLQYILGETEFMSLDFYVCEGVLIPRADTETLVECVLDEVPAEKKCKILDICAGSGCIGISLAYYRRNVTADLADISDAALCVSERNAGINGVSDRVKILKCDIINEYPEGKYDIIVSNPPYIESGVIETLQTEVRDHEPRLALDGGADGLDFYRRIAEIAPLMLKNNGLLFLETGYNQGEYVSKLLEENFTDIRVIKDLSGNDRVVRGVLL